MKVKNINTLDFREYIIKNKHRCKEWFFKADFHWTNRGAFNANIILCKYIQSILGCDLNFKYEYFDIENYNSKIYKEVFLGYEVGMAGILFVDGYENFELLTPKFNTDFEWICEEKGYYKRGEAEDVLILHEQLHGLHITTNHYAANSIIHARYTIVKNNNSPNDKIVFIINDSFSYPLSMFMTQQFKEVHFFDFRQEDFNTKLFKAIENAKPDIVIIMHCAQVNLSAYASNAGTSFCGAFNVKPPTEKY